MKKIAVVTGVAGGIGKATAKIFLEAGWHVVGIDSVGMDPSPADHFIWGDISKTETWNHIIEELQNKEARVDALINNAAIQTCKSLMETSQEEWDRIMAVNVRSVYLAVRACYPLMRSRSAAIVNVSSVHAVATSSNIAAYAASKGALVALTRAISLELALDNIRVNSVLPGAIDTGMLRDGLDRGHLQSEDLAGKLRALALRTPLRRIGRPEEIAQSILFLADNERSSFITGQTLVVDGGATARLSTE